VRDTGLEVDVVPGKTQQSAAAKPEEVESRVVVCEAVTT